MNLRKLMAWKGLLAVALVLTLVGGAVSLAATSKYRVQTPAAVETTQVTIKGFVFSPVTIKVPVGATVEWTNQDTVAHDVAARDGSWSSPEIETGKTFNYTFTDEGVYYYFCQEHPWMWGRVIVGNPANVPSQGTTSDWTQWMLDRMEQVHGQGSIDAMREYMDQVYGEGAFDGMLQSTGQNGGLHCGGVGGTGFGPGTFGGGMMGGGMMGGSFNGRGPGMMGNWYGR